MANAPVDSESTRNGAVRTPRGPDNMGKDAIGAPGEFTKQGRRHAAHALNGEVAKRPNIIIS